MKSTRAQRYVAKYWKYALQADGKQAREYLEILFEKCEKGEHLKDDDVDTNQNEMRI